MRIPHFLILAGDGVNCERETARAFELAGARASIQHVNDLLNAPEQLDKCDGLALPGGFSFGDELGSGRLLALKLRHQMTDAFERLVRRRSPIIGICNGFQVLMKLGLLPGPGNKPTATLTVNEGGHFIDRWVSLTVEPNTICTWTRTLGTAASLELPVRHGEGRVVFKAGQESAMEARLADAGQIVLRYKTAINGSQGNIAGLCDSTGTILGLMPHPEAFVRQATYRRLNGKVTAPGDGAGFFDSIISTLKNA